MAELSEDEKQSLDDALSTLDDLYEATLKADGGFHSEQTEAIAKLAEEAMACVLSVLDPEMYDAVRASPAPRPMMTDSLRASGRAELTSGLAKLSAGLSSGDKLRAA
jgi:hypothetical protein